MADCSWIRTKLKCLIPGKNWTKNWNHYLNSSKTLLLLIHMIALSIY